MTFSDAHHVIFNYCSSYIANIEAFDYYNHFFGGPWLTKKTSFHNLCWKYCI